MHAIVIRILAGAGRTAGSSSLSSNQIKHVASEKEII